LSLVDPPLSPSGLPNLHYFPEARIITVGGLEGRIGPSAAARARFHGPLVVCSAGTTDLSVAEEAATTAENFGIEVVRLWDVGVAGIHRCFDPT